jgi:hypothetical protein
MLQWAIQGEKQGKKTARKKTARGLAVFRVVSFGFQRIELNPSASGSDTGKSKTNSGWTSDSCVV